jgi:hypothetical protein
MRRFPAPHFPISPSPHLLLCAGFVILAFLRPAKAEEFLLHSGGTLEGDIVNADESPRATYVIALANGGQVTLDASAIDKVKAVKPELVEYEKARRHAPDTIAGQMQMADWCKEHHLPEQRKLHLQRVIQLDPDEAEARRMLGYQKYKDEWMTPDEIKTDQGYVKVDGRWLTQPKAELQENRDRQHKAEVDWIKKINGWRHLLDGRSGDEAARLLRSIDDPMAIFALSERLVKKPDPSAEARQIYVEVLGRLNHPAARRALAMCAIDDVVEEVRLCCLDQLSQQKDAEVSKYFVRRMRDKHTTNEVINRAGVALGRIKDASSIDTLIEYLVTVHDFVIPPAGGPGAMTTSFGKGPGGGGTGLGMNLQPKVIQKTMQNQGVLDALVEITGQNFGFNQRAWNTWYTNQKLKGLPVEAKEK